MKLRYRGVSYDYSPISTLKAGAAFAKGLYRGLPVVFRRVENVPAMPSYELKWRGVTYRSGETAPVAAPVPVVPESTPVMAAAPIELSPLPEAAPAPAVEAATPALSISDRSRNLFIQHHKQIRRREQGMMLRLAEKIGLPMEKAVHYESQIQGKIPHDFGGYDSSHRAMS